MKTKYFYIHGLGSSSKSSKFLELQKQYENIECLEWKATDNVKQIEYLLNDWTYKINNYYTLFDTVCIIASSTGANFALQLKDKFKPNIYLHLVLINPLLDIDYINDKLIMPTILQPSLHKFKTVNDCMILIGAKDLVIDHTVFLDNNKQITNNNNIIIDDLSTHKFESLNKYYSDIDTYINSLNI